MTAAADLVLTDAEVHTLADPDETGEAVAVRNGRIAAVGSAQDVAHLAGVETTVRECEGRVVLPGFVDAHTHLPMVGRRLVNADLSAAGSPTDAVSLLVNRAAETDPDAAGESGRDREWVLGFGYDESAWDDSRYLTAEDLDVVTEDRPVAAVREDMHLASLNSVALDRLRGEMPDADVHTRGGEPTGVVVEDALDALWEAIEPDRAAMRRAVRAAQERANELGVVGVHDMVRRSEAPAVYRELDRLGELSLRVRINYWADHLDAVEELGLRTNHGSERVRVGAIKTYTDGSIGGRTAKLSEPYADAERGQDDSDTERADSSESGTDGDKNRGQWVVDPDELRDIVARADDAGLQVAVHAIGDEAIRETLDAFESVDGERHRIEHAEVLTDDLVARIVESDSVASMQPNFLKWARDDGLYAERLGDDRRLSSNRFAELLESGAALAFGSDCMPLDPLYGVQQAVTALDDRQRLSVTDALRAYTGGAAYAGFDEDRLGTLEPGKLADLVVLDRSPWTVDPADVADIEVRATLVGGEVVFDRSA